MFAILVELHSLSLCGFLFCLSIETPASEGFHEVSRIKDGVDVDSGFPRDLCHTAVLCWIVTSTEDFNKKRMLTKPFSTCSLRVTKHFYELEFKQ